MNIKRGLRVIKVSKKLVEKRTKELDEQMKTCKHPPQNRITLSAGTRNQVCGLCGMVFQ